MLSKFGILDLYTYIDTEKIPSFTGSVGSPKLDSPWVSRSIF